MEGSSRTSEKFTLTRSSISRMLKRLPPCRGSMLSTTVTRAPRRTSSRARLLPMNPRPPVTRTSLSLNPSIPSLQFPEFGVLHEDVVHGGGRDDQTGYAVEETQLEEVVPEKTIEGSAQHVEEAERAAPGSQVVRECPRIAVD